MPGSQTGHAGEKTITVIIKIFLTFRVDKSPHFMCNILSLLPLWTVAPTNFISVCVCLCVCECVCLALVAYCSETNEPILMWILLLNLVLGPMDCIKI